MSGYDEWLTIREVSEITGYSTGYIRTLAKKSAIQAEKRGRDWFIDLADFLAHTREMQDLGTSKHDPWRTGARKREDDEDEAGE